MYNVYTWLTNISDKGVYNDTTFNKCCEKFSISDDYITLAKKQFFDQKQLSKGLYNWNSIRPNVKMAQRLIEEVDSNFKNNKVGKILKTWSKLEEDQLIKLAESGLKNGEIAIKMHRTVSSIEQKKHDLKLSKKTTQNKAEIKPQITKVKPIIQPKVESVKIDPIQEKKQASDDFGKRDVTFTINFSKIGKFFTNLIPWTIGTIGITGWALYFYNK